MNILVTGGAGFIGSHTVVELISAGHNAIILDNFCNSTEKVIENLNKITSKKIPYYKSDVRDNEALKNIFSEHSIDGVIHFAALKAVGESVAKPLEYYRNNIDGLLSLLEVMTSSGVNKLIFSSSATVYGDPDILPITEDLVQKPATNPYGATKQMAERIISDVCSSSDIKAVLLRYFNPIGAHESSLIGELPLGTPNNLVPFVTQTAAGIRKELTVFGNDYDTPDGSGVRDYIHVVDLAKAHVKSLEYIDKTNNEACSAFNLGTGKGTSVLEIISTFEKVNNVKVPYTVGARRPGDIASCYASADKANQLLDWKTELSLEDALRDAWNWQKTL